MFNGLNELKEDSTVTKTQDKRIIKKEGVFFNLKELGYSWYHLYRLEYVELSSIAIILTD